MFKRRGKYSVSSSECHLNVQQHKPSFLLPLITSTPIKKQSDMTCSRSRLDASNLSLHQTSAVVSPNTHHRHMQLFNASPNNTSSSMSGLLSPASDTSRRGYRTDHLPSFRYTPAYFDSLCPYNSQLASDDLCTSASSAESSSDCCSPLPSTSSDGHEPLIQPRALIGEGRYCSC